jgi:hypothetical protein
LKKAPGAKAQVQLNLKMKKSAYGYADFFMRPGNPMPDLNHIADLLSRFKVLESAGAGSPAHADHDLRNQLLDELQDAAGLNGRMVMERDIIRKAELLLKR